MTDSTPSWFSSSPEPHQPAPAPAQAPADGAPKASFGAPIARRWRLIVFLVLVGAAAGIAAGIVREPTYTADAQLAVGRADLATQSTQGYTTAVQNLASVYSRLVKGNVVITDVARQAGQSNGWVASRVHSSPIPTSSVFRISTDGSSAAAALKLNQQVVAATQAYITKLGNNGQDNAKNAFRKFTEASRSSALLRARYRRLQRSTGSDAPSDSELAKLSARADRYDLIARTQAQLYQNSTLPTTQQFKGADVVTHPFAADSDKASWIGKLGVAGAFVGLLVGIALALAVGEPRRGRAA